MSQIVTGIYNLGRSICHVVVYALVRDLTNYYWNEELAEYEKNQELQFLFQESIVPQTNELVAEITTGKTYDKFNPETFTSTDIEIQKPHTNPKSTSTYDLQENTEEESVGEKFGLGIIETFSDVGSVGFEDTFLQGLISDKPLECTNEEAGTVTESSADIDQTSRTDGCLHAMLFDAGDDMRNDLISENQLLTIETGSVNDWLYSITSPAICFLRSDEFLSVTQEEIESIQEQEMHEICEATDEIMLKQSYVNQWLIDSNEYVCSQQSFGDGDFM